jgi:hypothetical protein
MEWEHVYDWFWLPREPQHLQLADIIAPETLRKPFTCNKSDQNYINNFSPIIKD